jgi:hypothetical protein
MDHVEFPRYGYHSLQFAHERIPFYPLLQYVYNFFVFILIAVSQAARVLICPLQHCPAFYSQDGLKRGYPGWRVWAPIAPRGPGLCLFF